jgi:hypothetical protein
VRIDFDLTASRRRETATNVAREPAAEPADVTVLPPDVGHRPTPLETHVTNGLLPAVLQTKKGLPATDKPAGQRSCKKCGRSDRRFSGRHTVCNECRTPAPSVRWCDCGDRLEGHQQKCSACRMRAHPASSQCPFCLKWYWTHRGMGADQPQMRHHAQAQCIKQGPAKGVR